MHAKSFTCLYIFIEVISARERENVDVAIEEKNFFDKNFCIKSQKNLLEEIQTQSQFGLAQTNMEILKVRLMEF